MIVVCHSLFCLSSLKNQEIIIFLRSIKSKLYCCFLALSQPREQFESEKSSVAADFGILELFLMAILMVITFYTFYTFDNYFTYYTCYTLFLTFSPPVECSRQCASYLFRELVPRVYECSAHTCPAPSTALLSGGEPQSLPQPHVLRTEANADLRHRDVCLLGVRGQGQHRVRG